MKSSWKLVVAAGVVGLMAAPALAQTVGSRLWAPVRGIADDSGLAAPVVPAPLVEGEAPAENPFADEPAPLEPTAIDVGQDCGGCGTCGVGKCGGFGTGAMAAMCEGEPYHLWSKIAPCAKDCYNIDAGGWVQIGYFTEGANGNGTGLFNSYPNVVQLQQAWAYVEKAIDSDRCRAFDWGFRMDYVYGTDGPDTQAFGGEPGQWDRGWDNGGQYGHAIPQAYLDIAYNDLTLRVGHFYTICGYEVVQAPDNFFYSHAFTMYRAEPFTHTGVLAEYALGDNITLWGGWTAGWDTGFTANGGDVFLGGFSVALTDNMTFTYTTTMGDFGFDFEIFGIPFNGSDRDGYSHSIVFDWAITDKFNYVIQGDYVDNEAFVLGPDPFRFDKAWGVNQYFLYSINDCLKAGARVEYFDQEAYEVFAATVGLNIKPHANVVLRPEVRWDEYDDGNLLRLRDSFIFGMDMIVTF